MNKKDEPLLLHITTFAEVALGALAGLIYNGYKLQNFGLWEKPFLLGTAGIITVVIFILYIKIFNLKKKCF